MMCDTTMINTFVEKLLRMYSTAQINMEEAVNLKQKIDSTLELMSSQQRAEFIIHAHQSFYKAHQGYLSVEPSCDEFIEVLGDLLCINPSNGYRLLNRNQKTNLVVVNAIFCGFDLNVEDISALNCVDIISRLSVLGDAANFAAYLEGIISLRERLFSTAENKACLATALLHCFDSPSLGIKAIVRKIINKPWFMELVDLDSEHQTGRIYETIKKLYANGCDKAAIEILSSVGVENFDYQTHEILLRYDDTANRQQVFERLMKKFVDHAYSQKSYVSKCAGLIISDPYSLLKADLTAFASRFDGKAVIPVAEKLLLAGLEDDYLVTYVTKTVDALCEIIEPEQQKKMLDYYFQRLDYLWSNIGLLKDVKQFRGRLLEKEISL